MSKIRNDRTIKIRVLEDKLSKYIPYCQFAGHPGIPYDERKCERRECVHYYKFRMYNDRTN